MANAAAVRRREAQFQIKLSRYEYQVLHQSLADGFLLTFCGDSHARNLHKRREVLRELFPTATITFVGKGGLNIDRFTQQNYLHAANSDHAFTRLYRIAVLWLGSNDADVATWPVGRPLNTTGNRLLALRESLLESFDLCFVIGFPERDNCRGRNAQLVHQISLRSNQRLYEVLKGFYVKLPKEAFNFEGNERFACDGVHHSNTLYTSILRLVGQRINGIMQGDRRYVKIINENV